MKLTRVAPIGYQRQMAFVDRLSAEGQRSGGVESVEVPVYPEGRAAELRALIHELHWHRSDVAWLFGISRMDVLLMERGALIPDDWEPLFARLRKGPCKHVWEPTCSGDRILLCDLCGAETECPGCRDCEEEQ